MFNNLIESGSHRGELARKSRFMLGTLGLYGLLLAASGVASVFAYDARLERQNLEITSVITPVSVETSPRPVDDSPRPRGDENTRDDAVPERADAIARLNDSTTPPDTVSTRPNPLKELPDTGGYIITSRDFDPTGGVTAVGPRGDNTSGHAARERVEAPIRVNVAEDPQPPSPTPVPTPKPPDVVRVPSSVISGKVLSKPVPPYPKVAIATRTAGSVNVEILIDERGNVISARAVGGPAILRLAAEQAARQARFTPTLLGNQPVKVSGVITYNFVLN